MLKTRLYGSLSTSTSSPQDAITGSTSLFHSQLEGSVAEGPYVQDFSSILVIHSSLMADLELKSSR